MLVDVLLRRGRLPFAVTYEGVEGNLFRGVVCSQIRAYDIPFLPAGTVIKIQELRFSLPPIEFPELLVTAHNGKIEFSNGGMVFFRGAYKSGSIDLNLYAKETEFSTIASFVPGSRILQKIEGRIADLDAYITGTVDEPVFKGSFLIPEARLARLLLRCLPCSFDLTLKNWKENPLLFGRVLLEPAAVKVVKTDINSRQGTILFNGPAQDFAFHLGGKTTVQDTDIVLTLSGTLDKPDFQITSVPALPQETLLWMVLTGRNREAGEQPPSGGSLGTDVAKDFVDFLFLGGTGQTLSRRLGIEALELTYDARTQGVEIKKTVTDSASVIYGIKQEHPSNAEAAPVQTQKVGLEYKITDKICIEGTQEFRQESNLTQQEDMPLEGQIQLKYKKKF